MYRLCAVILMLALGGCATSWGEPALGFAKPAVRDAYLPLKGTTLYVIDARGAAVSITPDIAVTNAHNANLVPEGAVIGKSVNYDLLYFRRTGTPLSGNDPNVGERIMTYGQGADDDLRVATGTVQRIDAPVMPNCERCIVQSAFTFESNAGKGFSGGPVIDSEDGHLVGIVFGYVDDGGRRTMYAYPISRVMAELTDVQSHPQMRTN